MKNNGPKAKRCRRHGINLYGSDKYDKILQRKPHGPGKDPKDTKRGKPSEFSVQLKEKQKARDMYGLSESQFNKYYIMATKSAGQTGDAMKKILESRLDNVIYRAGFAQTRIQARQIVGHGHFLVNDVRVTVSSYMIKPGEIITVRPGSKSSPMFAAILAAHEKYMPPNWLRVDAPAMKIEVVSLPSPEHAEQAIEMRQIVEYYSRT